MKKNIILFFAIIMSFACHKDYNIYNESDFEAKIVLHSFASPDSILRVFVTKTVVPEQLDTNIFIKNAIVELYENDVFVENLEYFEKR
ncbi:MAG: hypothetical protein U9Q83_00110, partial [Bacteroidota bacterium]|nr:hypothetical protein [Bacteroidota bacterium]